MPSLTNTTDYNELLRRYGQYEGAGYNPARPILRRGSAGLGDLALQQLDFARELEPLRQGWARQFLMNLNPANIQARVDALSRRGRAGAARQQSMDASMAPFMGINPASLAAYQAQADQGAARMGQQARSPQGMADAYGQGFNAMSNFQDPKMLQLLAGLTESLESQHASGQAGRQRGGLGGLLGGLGQMFGMGGFGNLLGGGMSAATQAGNQAFMNPLRNMNFSGWGR